MHIDPSYLEAAFFLKSMCPRSKPATVFYLTVSTQYMLNGL